MWLWWCALCVRCARLSSLTQTFVVCGVRRVLCAARVSMVFDSRSQLIFVVLLLWTRWYAVCASMPLYALCVSLFVYSISGSSTVPFSLRTPDNIFLNLILSLLKSYSIQMHYGLNAIAMAFCSNRRIGMVHHETIPLMNSRGFILCRR